MKTRLTDLLEIQHPIIQGAMAWVADESLASAVSNAGGLGVVGTGSDDATQVQAKVERMFDLTDQAFGVNVYLQNPHTQEVMDYLAESGVAVVTTGAGNPGPYMDQLLAAGIKVLPVVPSVALAQRVERLGASGVICEGMEAGGHIGRLTTMALIPQVVDAVEIPVIAAGGIGDGRGLAAALALGAEGVQVGTRFVVAKESPAHAKFKAAILRAGDLDTVTTGELTGLPVRVLRNQLTRDYQRLEQDLRRQDPMDLSPLAELTQNSLYRAVIEGDTKQGSLMAGQIAGLVDREESVADILADYTQGAQATLDRLQGVFNHD